jgi:hypothetical protein
MPTDLYDRLVDLAAHRPPASAPAGLWERGVRRQRVVAAGRAAVALVLVLLVGLGGWTWHQARPIQPAGTQEPARVPDRLYQPSPWTPSFDGPPGPLVAVIPSIKSSWWHGDSDGFVGVTASTGRYAFLRLPDVATGDTFVEPVSLSPDGRRLAVWVTGSVPGRPIGAPVVGLDVYDLVTGSVSRWRPTTVHGLSLNDARWAGSDTLLVDVGQFVSGTSSGGYANDYANYRWDLPSGEPQRLEGPLAASSLTATNHLVVTSPRHGIRIADLDDASAMIRVTGGVPRHQPSWVNPSRTRIVGQDGQGDNGRLIVGRVPISDGDLLDRHVVTASGGRIIYALEGWLDDDHVIAQVGIRGVRGELDTIDVRTGEARPIIAPFVVSQVATGLLDGRIVRATPPPSPMNPHWLLAGGVVLLLLGAFTLRGLRGRRA